MFSSNNRISIRQMQILMIVNSFACIFTVLPKFLAGTAGNIGFILILLSGLIVGLFVSFCLGMIERCNKNTFKETVESIFGKKTGDFIYFLMTIKMLVSGGLMLRIFCEVIRETILFKTHVSITAFILLLCCIYAHKGGMEGFARTSEILFIIGFIPLVAVFFWAIADTNYTNILPIFDFRNQNILYGFIISLSVFFGIENIFVNYSYVNKNHRPKDVFITIIFISICASVAYFFTVARFGYITSASKLFPLITMLDTIEIPGAFIERQFIFVIWSVMASVFVFVNSALNFSKTFNRSRKMAIFSLIIVYFSCMLPSEILNTFEIFFIINIFGGIVFSIILPFIMALYCIGGGAYKK